MNVGDRLLVPDPGIGNFLICPFCKVTSFNVFDGRFVCGFRGVWTDPGLMDWITVEYICKNWSSCGGIPYNESISISWDEPVEEKVIEKHKCICDSWNLYHFGCACGGC